MSPRRERRLTPLPSLDSYILAADNDESAHPPTTTNPPTRSPSSSGAKPEAMQARESSSTGGDNKTPRFNKKSTMAANKDLTQSMTLPKDNEKKKSSVTFQEHPSDDLQLDQLSARSSREELRLRASTLQLAHSEELFGDSCSHLELGEIDFASDFDELRVSELSRISTSQFAVPAVKNERLKSVPVISNNRRGSDVSHNKSDRSVRFTVSGRPVKDKSRCAQSSNNSNSYMRYPEVNMLVQELNDRLATLEDMIENFQQADDEKMNGTMKNPSNQKPISVSMTSTQLKSLKGISSNFKGLLHCLNVRHAEQQSKILLTVSDMDHDESETSRIGGSGEGDEDQVISYRRLADTDSKKKLLEDLIGPEPVKKKDPKKKMKHRNTIMLGTSQRDIMNESGTANIPTELIQRMWEAEDVTDEGVCSAAFLAHEYGGVELPRKFMMTSRRPKKRSMKIFAKAISDAKVFVGQVKDEGNVGKCELEYLPREFTRLDRTERKRLAELLSWESLKVWGFDSFEVERLSAITMFKKSLTCEDPLDMSDTDLLGGSGSEKKVTFGRGDSHGSSSCDKSNNTMETSEHGCPMVLIGWALLASPYAQLAMAKNVKDEELMDKAQVSIRRRANTARGEMAKMMVGKSDLGGDSNYDTVESSKSKRGQAEGEGEIKDGAEKKGSITKPTIPSDPNDAWNGGYFLPDEFKVSPRTICRFLRKVEKEYSPKNINPYHNNVHGADVIQTTHSLIQMGGEDLELQYTPLETYSILLAAACHDIRHPGVNNNYQINKRTEVSLIYNDNSVLENMHASRASHLLEGIEDKNDASSSAAVESVGPNMLGTMTKDQRKMFRSSMIRSILHTDMSRHFSEVAKMERHVVKLEDEIEDEVEEKNLTSSPPSSPTNISFVSRVGGEKHHKLREKLLPFMLHLADISNPAKTRNVSVQWAECAYEEFFMQGDKEAAEDMPISPLCDRASTKMPEAQVGFMKFVVKPAFELLARCVPKVGDIVLRQLDENLKFWEEEKEKEKRESLAVNAGEVVKEEEDQACKE